MWLNVKETNDDNKMGKDRWAMFIISKRLFYVFFSTLPSIYRAQYNYVRWKTYIKQLFCQINWQTKNVLSTHLVLILLYSIHRFCEWVCMYFMCVLYFRILYLFAGEFFLSFSEWILNETEMFFLFVMCHTQWSC